MCAIKYLVSCLLLIVSAGALAVEPPTFNLPYGKWKMISLPATPPSGANSVKKVFGDNMGAGSEYDTDWVVYTYNPDSNSYGDPLAEGDALEQGRGYWIIQMIQEGQSVTLDMPSGSTETLDTQLIPLTPPTASEVRQWNFAGNPVATSLSLGGLRLSTSAPLCSDGGCDLDDAEENDLLHNKVWIYDGDHYVEKGTSDQLDAWTGFWVAALGGSKGHSIALGKNETSASVKLQLPGNFHLPVNETMRIYFDNIVNVSNIANYKFEVLVGNEVIGEYVGNTHMEFTENTTGTKILKINVRDLSDKLLATQSAKIKVYTPPTNIPNTKILVMGDSITDLDIYVARLKNRVSNENLEFIGTNRNASPPHEGWNGASWHTFNDGYNGHLERSPTVFDGKLNIRRYFNEKLNGDRPDYVTIMLGINDIVWMAKKSRTETIEYYAPFVFRKADTLINAIRKEAPGVKIFIASIISPNQKDALFPKEYRDSDYSGKKYRDIQLKFVGLQEKHFSGRENEGVYFFSTYHEIDTRPHSFSSSSYIHPTETGLNAIGDVFYNELMWNF